VLALPPESWATDSALEVAIKASGLEVGLNMCGAERGVERRVQWSGQMVALRSSYAVSG
jgi:hypothetical protein